MWRSSRRARGAAVLVLLACAGLACERGPAPPSILLVTLDTLRRDHLGAYGSERGLTPELDALAAGALVHDAAYTTMPTTGPAHASLFTGLLPSEHGSLRNAQRLAGAGAGELAVRLSDAGYATAAFVGTQLLGPAATGFAGFQVYDPPKGVLRHGDQVVDAALAWLDAERQRPVFLWVHLYDPHAPYGSADEKRVAIPLRKGRYGWIPPERRDEASRREMAERYARGVRSADAAAGRLVRGVLARLARPPFVVAVADHGETLDERLQERGFGYDHGEFLDAESVEIPLLVAGPGVAPGRSAGAASISDLYATLLAMAGVLAPDAVPRDLRRADPGPRAVVIQRRSFTLPPHESVRGHAAAAADGRHLVIVGDTGSPTWVPAGAARELIALARRHVPEPTEPPDEPDPATRAALESLGYAE